MEADLEAEFETFVVTTSARLLHAGDLLTGSRARAEDLVQHALAAAYARWPAIHAGHPEAYVRTTMLNRHLDWWRRLRWREVALPDTADDAETLLARDPRSAAGADPAIEITRRDVVQRALSQLTRQERAVVVLRFWFDLSEVQIAQELKVRPGTVKSTCARALSKLRTSPGIVSTEGAWT